MYLKSKNIKSLFFLFNTIGVSQNSIRGTITDIESNETLLGVNVYVPGYQLILKNKGGL